MARGKHQWVQFEIKRAATSEAWVIVRHRRGVFRLPADVALAELCDGVILGWDESSTKLRHAAATYRVPMGEYEAFLAWRRDRLS